MTVGEVRRLDRAGSPPLAAASAAYLATLSGPEQRNTQRAYRSTLRALAAEFAPAGTLFAVADLGSEENTERLTAWFTARWSGRAPATFNRHLDAVRSAASFWISQDWLAADPSRRLRRRGRAPDRTLALGAAEVEEILGMDVPVREKTLWTMLYETAARTSEVLALDVEDLDRRNRRSKVTRKGSAVDIIVWQTGTARLLPRLLDGRARRPVFLTDRRPRRPGRRRPRPGLRPRPALVPAGRGDLHRADQASRAPRHHRPRPTRGRGRLDASPAPALGADQGGGERREHRDPAGLLRPYLGREPGPLHPGLARRARPLAGRARPAPAALTQPSSGSAAAGSRKGRSPAAAGWVKV